MSEPYLLVADERGSLVSATPIPAELATALGRRDLRIGVAIIAAAVGLAVAGIAAAIAIFGDVVPWALWACVLLIGMFVATFGAMRIVDAARFLFALRRLDSLYGVARGRVVLRHAGGRVITLRSRPPAVTTGIPRARVVS